MNISHPIFARSSVLENIMHFAIFINHGSQKINQAKCWKCTIALLFPIISHHHHATWYLPASPYFMMDQEKHYLNLHNRLPAHLHMMVLHINSLCFLLRKQKHYLHFCIISWSWGSWNRSFWKTRTFLFCMFIILAAVDGMVIQGVETSRAKLLS